MRTIYGVDTTDAWIRERTGIGKRRIAGEGEATSDMATGAAKQALEMANLTAQDLDMIIVGTPDQCMKKIEHYAQIGVDQLLCYVQFGYLPHESVMRTIELLGTEIIPELEKQGHQAEATVAAK